MACGKPVVATRNGGSEEVVVNESVGMLCNKKSPIDLSEKLTKALGQTWNPLSIVEYARKFEWKNICNEIAQIYEEVLE
jgi:glycosyltransferase involved in cell wall biosynthesis